jgi:hypothetical protein
MGDEAGIYERWKESSEKEYALARSMVANGATPMAVCQKLAIPYSRALNLHSKARREIFVEGPTRMGPEADAALKDDLTEKLIKVVNRCDEVVDRSFDEGNPNTKHYDKLLGAAKQLSAMRGYNAPTRSVNEEWKIHALASPEVQRRIMSDPAAREAFLVLEEFAASQPASLDAPDDAEGGGS